VTERAAAHRLKFATATLRREFEGVFSRETVEETVGDSYRKLAATATVTTFLDLFAERFARERLTAAARSEGRRQVEVPEVLFVCVHNAGRSQMAAGLLNNRAEGKVLVRSAGSDPADRLNPAVVEAMGEIGIDVSKEFPKPLTDELVRASDVVITWAAVMRARYIRERSTATGSFPTLPARTWPMCGLSATRSTVKSRV